MCQHTTTQHNITGEHWPELWKAITVAPLARPHTHTLHALVPRDSGLALVGDAQRGDVARLCARLRHGLLNHRHRIAPDLLGAVLHLPGLGEVLRVLLLLAWRREGNAADAMKNMLVIMQPMSV